MAKKPMFSDLEVKFQNRRQKDILKTKTRLIKFNKGKTPVPKDFTEYMKYLEM